MKEKVVKGPKVTKILINGSMDGEKFNGVIEMPTSEFNRYPMGRKVR